MISVISCDLAWGYGPWYLRAGQRWYLPGVYRWQSRDPIRYDGGDNVYAYVGGNPVKWLDPSGLEADYNFVNPKDPMYGVGDHVELRNDDSELTVVAHGSPKQIEDENGNTMTAEDLADVLKKDPNYDKARRIGLHACLVGRGRNSFAQQLANLTGKPVLAPTGLIEYDPPKRPRLTGGRYLIFYP